MNFFLRVAPQKKFNVFMPGELWGHMMSDLCVFNLPGSLTSSQSIAILEVWAGVLSCMKKVRLLTSSKYFGNISIDNFVYCAFVTFSSEPVSGYSKKAGPITVVEDNPPEQ